MQHIIDYRNKYTIKNSEGNPVSWAEAHRNGKYDNMLCVEDPETNEFLPLREATNEEVVIAFDNGLKAGADGDNTVDVDINGITTKCYVFANYADFWHEDRLVTDNIEVNDGQVTYYTYEGTAEDGDNYDPTDDQEYFESNYDHNGEDGEVTATLTNLITGKTYTWTFSK